MTHGQIPGLRSRLGMEFGFQIVNYNQCWAGSCCGAGGGRGGGGGWRGALPNTDDNRVRNERTLCMNEQSPDTSEQKANHLGRW